MKPVRTRTKSFRVNWSSSSPRNVAPKATKEEFSRKSYIVERIVDNRTKAGQKQYFLKWKGFPSADNTWEPVSSLVPNCSSLIEEYELSQRRKADVSVAADESTRGLRESSSESEDLTPMEIVGAVRKRNKTMFWVRLANGEEDLVKATHMNASHPAMVISFYERHITWKSDGGVLTRYKPNNTGK